MHDLSEFPHGHVPSPLRIADHRGGDRTVDDLLREILILTKLNWNSADFGALYPITLGSSREVADVLREVPLTCPRCAHLTCASAPGRPFLQVTPRIHNAARCLLRFGHG